MERVLEYEIGGQVIIIMVLFGRCRVFITAIELTDTQSSQFTHSVQR